MNAQIGGNGEKGWREAREHTLIPEQEANF
jgi:hypothetical protein